MKLAQEMSKYALTYKRKKVNKFTACLKVETLVIIFHFPLQLLQNLGKADKTTDEIFEEHLLNFNQQQANATRLQKDISNYIRCIKGNGD